MSWILARKLRKIERLERRAKERRRETIVRGQQTAVLMWRSGLGIFWLLWCILRGVWRTGRWSVRTLTAKPTGFRRKRGA